MGLSGFCATHPLDMHTQNFERSGQDSEDRPERSLTNPPPVRCLHKGTSCRDLFQTFAREKNSSVKTRGDLCRDSLIWPTIGSCFHLV